MPCDRHRAVPSARAADRYHQVRFPLRQVLRQEVVEQRVQPLVEGVELAVAVDEVDHTAVVAGERPQVRLVVGVGQEAHVEQEIGGTRRAILEAEAHKRDQQVLRFSLLKQPDGMLPQLVNRELRGVENMVGHGADRRKPIALERDRFEHRPVGIERMRPSRLAEPAHQHGVRRFEKP